MRNYALRIISYYQTEFYFAIENKIFSADSFNVQFNALSIFYEYLFAMDWNKIGGCIKNFLKGLFGSPEIKVGIGSTVDQSENKKTQKIRNSAVANADSGATINQFIFNASSSDPESFRPIRLVPQLARRITQRFPSNILKLRYLNSVS